MAHYSPWRIVPEEVYESCKRHYLGDGLVIGRVLPVSFIEQVYFQNFCEDGAPVYNAAKIKSRYLHYSDLKIQDWKSYTTASSIEDLNGSFAYGIYPVILCFTANFVITVFLTLLTFINIKGKRYRYAARLLKIGSMISSVNIVVFVTRALKQLSKEHEAYGVTTTAGIMELFTDNMVFSILDLISFFLLQLCQVMIVTRLFHRNSEKRMVFFLGVLLVLIANVLWAIAHLAGSNRENDEHWEIMSPFVYLFRIAVAASYASIIISYGIMKRRFCFASAQMAILTVLTALVLFLQPALFLADVSNVWLSGVGELFNSACYVGSTSIVWEWLGRLEASERREEAQSILGRPIYVDDQRDYHIAKYALRIQHALTQKSIENTDEGSGIDMEQMSNSPPQLDAASRSNLITSSGGTAVASGSFEQESVCQVRFKQKQPFKDAARHKISTACERMLYFADQVMLKSLGTLSLSSKSTDTFTRGEEMVKKRIGLDRPNQVYVYSTKDVQFESDDDI
ncbi:hypothetical protein HG537_0E02190 [Torulaspora globosa]|uniref:pH-response regulator protein palH/RIM21 n=1 Tax=Torulaspora globosa TaxID=48254 RepID=A0A7H9HT12_9SACH|nr:hypothetical protein HG537_0E02190 [Torulaspora sp. CBS 2947]